MTDRVRCWARSQPGENLKQAGIWKVKRITIQCLSRHLFSCQSRIPAIRSFWSVFLRLQRTHLGCHLQGRISSLEQRCSGTLSILFHSSRSTLLSLRGYCNLEILLSLIFYYSSTNDSLIREIGDEKLTLTKKGVEIALKLRCSLLKE